MADRIEEIMLEAYESGIHTQVLEVVTQIQYEHRFDLKRAYEIALHQTRSNYETGNDKNVCGSNA
jgi:hypothetical protein